MGKIDDIDLQRHINNLIFADFEGKTDMKIRNLEIVEELRTQRADKQVEGLYDLSLFDYYRSVIQTFIPCNKNAMLGYKILPYLDQDPLYYCK